MSNHHDHKKVFIKVLVINIIVFVAEFVIALSSGSLTMLSDSFHVFLHILASLIGFISEFEFWGLPPEKIKKNAALVNVSLFFLSAGIVTKEAIERIFTTPDITLNLPFFIIAFLGLGANIYSGRIIDGVEHNECSHNMETLHACMVYDAAGSVIVIMGALAMYFTEIFILDPILSLALVIFMLLRGLELLKKTLALGLR